MTRFTAKSLFIVTAYQGCQTVQLEVEIVNQFNWLVDNVQTHFKPDFFLSNKDLKIAYFKATPRPIFSRSKTLTPSWSLLIFWNIHFGIHFKLGKKFSYKLTEIFFQCSLKFFFSSNGYIFQKTSGDQQGVRTPL